MGIFSRLKRTVKSKANAAIDNATDPETQLDMAIVELDEQHKSALQELLAYKTSAKAMEQDMERQQKSGAEWEKRAMAAVTAGNDELARKALAEKKRCEAEVVKIQRDRDEAAGYAIQLNRSRKAAETKLRILKLKKGSLAAQIAVARGGKTNALGYDEAVWDRFDEASERIDDEAIKAEVDAALVGEEADGSPLLASSDSDGAGTAGLLATAALSQATASHDADMALATLKAKLDQDGAKKKLTE